MQYINFNFQNFIEVRNNYYNDISLNIDIIIIAERILKSNIVT